MKLVLSLIIILASISTASAITRYDVASKTCAEVQAILERDGAAILRYTSQRVRGLPLYQRAVSDGRFCSSNDRTVVTTVPTRDNSKCVVLHCRGYAATQ